jgi:hypothetical protein
MPQDPNLPATNTGEIAEPKTAASRGPDRARLRKPKP